MDKWKDHWLEWAAYLNSERLVETFVEASQWHDVSLY